MHGRSIRRESYGLPDARSRNSSGRGHGSDLAVTGPVVAHTISRRAVVNAAAEKVALKLCEKVSATLMERAVENDSGQRLLESPMLAFSRPQGLPGDTFTNSIYDEYLCIAIEIARRLARIVILYGISRGSLTEREGHVVREEARSFSLRCYNSDSAKSGIDRNFPND